MSASTERNRAMLSYLEDRVAGSPPDGLLAASLARIEATRQRPGWLVADRWVSPGVQARSTTASRRLRLVGLVAIVALAAVGVALIVGAALRLSRLPANGAIDLVVNGRLVEIDQAVDAPRAVVTSEVVDGSAAWSRDGTHLAVWVDDLSPVFVPGTPTIPAILILDPAGMVQATIPASGVAGDSATAARDTGVISWAPDGRSIVFDAAVAGRSRLYRYDLATATITPINPADVEGHRPSWSTDAGLIAFFSTRTGQTDQLWVVRPDGSDVHRVGAPLPAGTYAGSDRSAPQWSSDGRRVAFDARAATGSNDNSVYVVDIASDRQVQLGADLRGAVQPVWGPDQGEIAFMNLLSVAAVGSDVYVARLDTGAARLLVADADLWGWSPDGTRLLIGSPGCSNRQGPGAIADTCRESLYTIAPDGTDRRLLASAAQLEAIAATPGSPWSNVAGVAWRPVQP